MHEFLNPSQHLCLPAMDRLLRLIEHETRDSSKCVEKGKALVHLSFRDLLYRKFLEFYGMNDLYGKTVAEAKKRAEELYPTHKLELTNPVDLHDFLAVFRLFVSEKNRLHLQCENVLNLESVFEQFPVKPPASPDFLRTIGEIVRVLLLQLRIEGEIESKQAFEAQTRLVRKVKGYGDCPELSFLFAFGGLERPEDYPKILNYLLRKTNWQRYRINRDEKAHPQDFSDDKRSFLNEAITEVLVKMWATKGLDMYEQIADEMPYKNILQKLRHGNRRKSRLMEERLSEADWRFSDDEVAEEQRKTGIMDKQSIYFEEHLPEIREAFGEAKTKVIAAAYSLYCEGMEVTNEQIAKQINRHIKTVEKHKKELRDDSQNLQKFQEILFF